MKVSDIQVYSTLFIALCTSAVFVIGAGRWLSKRLEARIVDVIVDSTSQIKTDANGGQSLNDVSHAVKELANALHTHMDDVRDASHKRDAQIERLHYEIALVKRVSSIDWDETEGSK